jgi:hypothetical protein
MKGPYENVLLGAFIFRLGYKMGQSRKLENEQFAANLFQQTPLDQVFSDFMYASDARGFLLEFKKSWEGRDSERKKDKYKLMQEQPTLLALAEKCHLLGYGKDINSQGSGNIELFFGTYLEVVSAKSEKELKVRWPMKIFLQKIVDEKIGANFGEFRDYIRNFLELLKQRHRYSSKGLFANALASATGAVAIIHTRHALHPVPISSIIDLGVNLKIGLAEELSQKIELSRKIEPPSRETNIEVPSLGIDTEASWKIEGHQRGIGMNMDE